MVEEGSQAPDFELESDDGRNVKLSELRGTPVVLYFYPKDDTPGCTTEACEFRDVYERYRERGIDVIGVSPDTPESHTKFRSKYELPFPLLADPGHELAEAFGVWKERTSYGKTSTAIERSTFVIDPEGRVASAMRGIRPAGHAEEVLAALS